jgi:hypothetical protein
MARKPTGRKPGRPRNKIQYFSDVARVIEMRLMVLREEVVDYKEAARRLAHNAEPQGYSVPLRSKRQRLRRLYEIWLGAPWFVARVDAALQRPRRRRRHPFIEARRLATEMFEARRLTLEMMRVHELHLEYMRFQRELARTMVRMAEKHDAE